ncbi:hypothetical protein ABQF35_14205 [Mycobacterium syngnathidarum]
MTDTRLGRSPRSSAEWVREIERRTTALERAQTARIGPWVLSDQNGRLTATRPNAAALEVGSEAVPETVDLSARGSVVSEMNTATLAEAVGMPDVDPDAPPTIDQIRQWMMTNLFGQVSPSRIPQLPWAHLFDGKAELLDDPGFDNASTFNSGDPKINRDAEFGRRRPGSARIDCDGAPHLVVSNLIPVEQGESLPIGAWVFYEELAASTAPIRVSVRAYHRNDDDSLTLLSTTQVAALSVLSGDSADHPDQDDDWVWLGGTYLVPGPIGGLSVDECVAEVKVDATSGTAWADDATVTKTRDGMPQDWILDLIPDLTNLGNWIEEVVDKALTGLGIPPIGSLFDKMLDFQDGLADLDDMAGAAWTNANNALTDLANKLGISDWNSWLTAQWNVLKNNLLTNPGAVIGNLTQDLVEGLEDDLADAGDAIADVFDDLRDGWNKFWDGIYKTSGSTGKTAADVQTAALEVINTATAAHVNIETANAAVATWQSQFTQQQMAQPLWLTGTDGTCEVTIPLAWCQYWPKPGGGHNSFALSCGTGSHTHPVDSIPIVLDEFKVRTLFASLDNAGDFIGGVMRCRGGDLKDTITTYGVMTPGSYFVIYEMDVTNGSVHRLYESAALPGSSGGLSVSPIVHEMPAGSEFITTVGQVLVVGVWSPESAPFTLLAGAPVSSGYTTLASSFPKSIGVRDTGWSGSAPATMNDGDFTYMSFDSTLYSDLEKCIVPFFGLGSASPPAPVARRRFVSQFATLGVSDWVNVTGSFGTVNGELSSSALAAGVYKDPLATDSPATEIHLSPTKTVGKTRIAVKSNADMSKWIGVEFDRTSSTAMTAKIVTGTGPDSGLTPRFTSANVGTNYGPLEADPITGTERVGGARFRLAYTQASNTYELFLFNPLYYSWSSLGTWVDSGGFTAHGLEHRYGGAVTGVNGTPNKGQAVTRVEFFDS